MGQLEASISHEVIQPIASAITNAGAALHFLDSLLPDLEEAREALTGVVGDGKRASDIMSRIRALFKKAIPRKEQWTSTKQSVRLLPSPRPKR